jgi:glutathione S-transferase
MTGGRVARVAEAGLRFLPTTRQELGRAMLAEAAAMAAGPIRRKWLCGACWFIVKCALPIWLRWTAIAASALFICWIGYNGIDSGFQGTPPEVASYLGLIALLTLNIVLLARRHR